MSLEKLKISIMFLEIERLQNCLKIKESIES